MTQGPVDFLVFSHRHGLVPIAHRLRSSGAPVELVINKRTFEGAWAGGFDKVLSHTQGSLTTENMDLVRQRVAEGLTALVSDTNTVKDFHGPWSYRTLDWDERPPSGVRLGAWFDGQDLKGHHFLVLDMGAWPGGLGLQVAGGATLVHFDVGQDLSPIQALWAQIVEQLKARDFRGLVNAGLEVGPEGVHLTGVEAGWPWLHTHAWLSALTNLRQVLAGAAPVFEPEARYVVALPVTVPPWPIWPVQVQARAEAVQLGGLAPEDLGRWFWHDVTIDAQERVLRGAGRDGLLGVARGSGHHLEVARASALEQASRLQVPGKQLRADVAAQTPRVLSLLELHLGMRVG